MLWPGMKLPFCAGTCEDAEREEVNAWLPESTALKALKALAAQHAIHYKPHTSPECIAYACPVLTPYGC